MAIKRVFYVTTSSLTILLCDKGQVQVVKSFGVDEDGRRGFAIALQEHKDFKSAFLVDFIEEEFRVERVAHVVGVDRAQYLKRKAKSLFNVELFTTAQIVGRDQGGRRDDVGVFYSLNRSDIVGRWLDEARAAKVPLAGVFSVPMVGNLLLNKLKLKDNHILLVSIQNERFIRQSFFDDGKLKLSRLSPLTVNDSTSLAMAIIEEIRRSKAYLLRISLITREQPLQVYVLTPDSEYEYISAELSELDKTMPAQAFALSEIATELKLSHVEQASKAEHYFAYLLHDKIPQLNYAENKEKIYFQLSLLRQSLFVSGAIIAVLGLAWSAVDLYEAFLLNQEISYATEKKIALETHISDEIRIAESYGQENTLLMRETVELTQALQNNKPDTFLVPSILGAMMTNYPNIELNTMSWAVVETAQDAAMPMAGEPVGGEPVWQVMKLELALKSPPQRYSDIFKQIEEFRADLARKTLVIEAKVTKFPIDIAAESNLSGESKLGEMGADTVEFSIEVTFKKELSDVN